MDTCEFTKLQNRIFALLAKNAGHALNQRAISKLLGVSPTAVANGLPTLEQSGLITVHKSKDMNLSEVTFNRDAIHAIHLKRVENLRQIYITGLADFIRERFPGCIVILFGSYAFGEDTLSSDIDIAVIGSHGNEPSFDKYDRLLQRKVSLHYFSNMKRIPLDFKASLMNGIVISGMISA